MITSTASSTLYQSESISGSSTTTNCSESAVAGPTSSTSLDQMDDQYWSFYGIGDNDTSKPTQEQQARPNPTFDSIDNPISLNSPSTHDSPTELHHSEYSTMSPWTRDHNADANAHPNSLDFLPTSLSSTLTSSFHASLSTLCAFGSTQLDLVNSSYNYLRNIDLNLNGTQNTTVSSIDDSFCSTDREFIANWCDLELLRQTNDIPSILREFNFLQRHWGLVYDRPHIPAKKLSAVRQNTVKPKPSQFRLQSHQFRLQSHQFQPCKDYNAPPSTHRSNMRSNGLLRLHRSQTSIETRCPHQIHHPASPLPLSSSTSFSSSRLPPQPQHEEELFTSTITHIKPLTPPFPTLPTNSPQHSLSTTSSRHHHTTHQFQPITQVTHTSPFSPIGLTTLPYDDHNDIFFNKHHECELSLNLDVSTQQMNHLNFLFGRQQQQQQQYHHHYQQQHHYQQAQLQQQCQRSYHSISYQLPQISSYLSNPSTFDHTQVSTSLPALATRNITPLSDSTFVIEDLAQSDNIWTNLWSVFVVFLKHLSHGEFNFDSITYHVNQFFASLVSIWTYHFTVSKQLLAHEQQQQAQERHQHHHQQQRQQLFFNPPNSTFPSQLSTPTLATDKLWLTSLSFWKYFFVSTSGTDNITNALCKQHLRSPDHLNRLSSATSTQPLRQIITARQEDRRLTKFETEQEEVLLDLFAAMTQAYVDLLVFRVVYESSSTQQTQPTQQTATCFQPSNNSHFASFEISSLPRRSPFDS